MKLRRIHLAAVILLAAALTVTVFAQMPVDQTQCPIPPNGANTCRMTPVPQANQINSIADFLSRDNRVSIANTALVNTGLAMDLRNQGPYTIFVPTNEAFNRLPEGTRNALFLSENTERLRDIMLTHIVQGASLSMQDLRNMSTLTTANCQVLAVRNTAAAPGIAGGDMYVGNARIVGSSNNGANGMIYYVDNILVPGCSDVNMMNDVYLTPGRDNLEVPTPPCAR